MFRRTVKCVSYPKYLRIF